MKVKFLGQNCFLFSYKGKNILTDPFYNFQKEKSGFDISSQKIDYVFRHLILLVFQMGHMEGIQRDMF